MKATLWDGNKQLNGELELKDKGIQFKMNDFSQTNLNLDLVYESIQAVKLHRVFSIDLGAVEIITTNDEHNVFVVEDPIGLKDSINNKIKIQSKISQEF